jgi:S1-C subfamily serine protease
MPIVLGGDLIVAIDGHEVTSKQDLSNALNEHHAGDTITVTVFRGQRRMNMKVTLSDATQQPTKGEQT